MPELPEVETIVRYLRPRILGKRIVRFEPKARRVLRDHRNPSVVKRAVLGARISDLSRIGKNILFKLSNGKTLAIHPMMSGRLLWDPVGDRPHDRLVMYLTGGHRLVFNDTRQFGRVRLVENPRAMAGPDALRISWGEFQGRIANRIGALKPLFLSQRVISGIGNIYADEILWQAGIHPLRKASRLRAAELRGLYRAMGAVLRKAIRTEGSSMQFFVTPDAREGGYFPIRRAYRRAGERCSRDGARIRRITVGQRSTYFCPKHQR